MAGKEGLGIVWKVMDWQERHFMKKQLVKRTTYKQALEELEQDNNGVITPHMVVDSARNDDSPLHGYFEWNDEIAGEKYRIWQARVLLTTVKVEYKGTTTDAYFNAVVTIDDASQRGYVTMQRAISDEEIYKQVLSVAARELEYWQNKYKTISDLKDIVNVKKLTKIKEKLK